MHIHKYGFLLGFILISCGGEPAPITEDIGTMVYMGFIDVSDGFVVSSSPNINIMEDNTYSITFLELTQAPDGCTDPLCLCLEQTKQCSLADAHSFKVKYGTVSAQESGTFASATRTPVSGSKLGKNCRYYSVTPPDVSVMPWTEKVCTDGDLDALDLEIQRIMNTLIARAE